ncbi:response regulator [Andreprevotia sp. IGB-42]|uniref:response regulator n=1 Tax=Andreprevotia sp. IGB-42 TaxID=2497473 RepID=UPI001358120F|nr:response regulator [Andreprevotia sp. IGB-42]
MTKLINLSSDRAAMTNKTLGILYVEDSEILSSTIVEYLQELEFDVVAVSSAEEATAMLEQRSFDVLFTDVGLPGRSGAVLAKEVTAMYPGMRIILASGYDLSQQAFSSNVVLLPKPFDLDAIERALTLPC